MSPTARTRPFARACRLHASGAALLETLVVLPVMLTIAFNALEFSRYGQARMIVRYAQVQGMRECAVSGDHPNNPTGDANGMRLSQIAASEALRPLNGRWFDAPPGRCVPGGTGENSPASFELNATYRCSYPLSFCRVAGPMAIRGLPDTALSMPMQTAFYDKRGSVQVDPSTVCRESGGTKECTLTTQVDAGGPVGPDCTGTGTQLLMQCEQCAAACTTQTCAESCRSTARTAAQGFTSGNSSCGSQVTMMVSACGSCWNQGGVQQCM